jgi:hypothetical protein
VANQAEAHVGLAWDDDENLQDKAPIEQEGKISIFHVNQGEEELLVVGESHCFWKGSDAGEFLGTKNIPTTQKTKRGKDENLNSKLTGAQSHGHLGAGGLPWCFSEVEEVAHC